MPRRIEVPSGTRFGKLVVLVELEAAKDGGGKSRRLFSLACDCGGRIVSILDNLRSGHTSSCGCARGEKNKSRTVHGASSGRGTPEYNAWLQMRKRCQNPRYHYFHRYGGRGITVCQEWANDFERFLSDMGPKPSPQHSLDRIDNDGGYSASNCRWASKDEQSKNKSSNIWLTLEGETMCIADWSRRLGAKNNVLLYRYHAGWSDQKILTTPI